MNDPKCIINAENKKVVIKKLNKCDDRIISKTL